MIFHKRPSYRFLLGTICCFLLAASPLRAIHYNFQHYSLREGLPHSQVKCVMEDSLGYIWVGTEAGVARFDGQEFETFSNEPAVFEVPITAITETKSGIFLASSKALLQYRYGKFSSFPFNGIFSQVNQLTTNASGQLFLATEQGLFEFTQGHFSKILTTAPFNTVEIRCMYYNELKQELWVGTDHTGIVVLRQKGKTFSMVSIAGSEQLSNAHVRGIDRQADGTIMIATSGEGLYAFASEKISKRILPEEYRNAAFTSIQHDDLGEIWLGTWGDGVIRWNKEGFTKFNKKNGLGDDIVTTISKNRNGGVWFGSYSAGLIFFADDNFVSFNIDDGLPDNNIRGIVEDESGVFWIATMGGLAYYDGLAIGTISELQDKRISGLTLGKQNQVYAVLVNGEVVVLQNKKINKRYQLPAGNTNIEAISIKATDDGTVWIGTVSDGLFRIRNGRYEKVDAGDLVLNNAIWSIYENSEGTLWLGTNNGLLLLSNGIALRPESANKPFTEIAFDVTGDKNYIYFASNKRGIGRYSYTNHQYQFLNKKEGLRSNYTKGLLYSDSVSLFVTHLQGIDKIHFLTDTQYVQHFSAGIKFGSTDFNPGVICLSSGGHIWLGSTEGVVIYNPNHSTTQTHIPHLLLGQVYLRNEIPDWSKYTDSLYASTGLPVNPEFPYDDNRLSFTVTQLKAGSTAEFVYRYRLKGFDKDWIILKDNNHIDYANLPPGKYRFETQVGTAEGVWGDRNVFKFTIKKPFWSTWWFFLIILCVIGSLSALMLLVYKRNKLQFVRQQRSLNDNQLLTSRLVLFVGAICYPGSGVTCYLFAPDIENLLYQQFIIGTAMLILGVGTFYIPAIRKQSNIYAHSFYGIILLHILYLNYLNNLEPLTVVMLIVALSALGIILESFREQIVFSAGILSISSFLLINDNNSGYNKWMFIVAVLVCLIIAFVNLVSRLNMFNRLLFADTTINNSSSLVIAADQKGDVIFVSRSIKRLLGYTEDEVLGQGWWQIRSDDQEFNVEIRERILRNESMNSSYVVPIRTKLGHQRWIQWVDTSLENGIKVGVGLDVTDRHDIEERYRLMIESATDIIYTADYKGNFTFVNEVAQKITGYTNAELIGNHFTNLVSPEWREDTVTFYRKQFSRRVVSTYYEFPMLAKSGKISWIGQTVRILFNPENQDMISGFQAIARDITEKKEYEDELEKLSLVASETINGVMISDENGNIDWVNEAVTRITGYTLSELKGKRPADVMAGENTDMRAVTNARIQSARGNGFEVELLFYHKEGYEVWFSISNTPIVDEDGDTLKYIEIYTDISEKKRYELQLNSYSRRLEILNAVRQELLRSQNMDVIAAQILKDLLARMPHCVRISICNYDFNTDTVNLYYLWRNGNGEMQQLKLQLSELRSLDDMLKNKHFLCNDLTKEESLSISDRMHIKEGIQSYLLTPLWTQGQLLGSINLFAQEKNTFNEQDVELAREIADAMAVTLLQIRYREIIDQKSNDISASINYARRIQDSILPPNDVLSSILGDAFVIYKPKDILSGDYYWVESLEGKTYVAVADSTGHGVPGALLSMMGHNMLNQAVLERKLQHPAEILDFLNSSIQHQLNQYKMASELHDGMDISLCVIDTDNNRLEYAGAINPLYLIRDNALIQIKGDRFSIGSYFDHKVRPFTNNEVDLIPGDMIYLFSDGYPDQFGGDDDRKLSHRTFRELLLAIHSKEPQQQKLELEKMLSDWMRDSTQTDDITVLGVRIH